MLSSIPLITPRGSHTLWYTPTSTFGLAPPLNPSTSSPPTTSQNVHPTAGAQLLRLPQQQSRSGFQVSNTISPLAQLALDEASVDARKNNIRKFGAQWIKPPGISKTLQGEMDDFAEKAEAIAAAAGGVDDGDGVGEEDIGIGGAGVGGVGGAGGVGFAGEDDEEDLDADIPEGESFEGDDDDDDDDLEEEEEVDLDADVPEADDDDAGLWDDSDEEDVSDENGEEFEEEEEDQALYEAATQSTQATESLESSPQQPLFSHDERFGPQEGEVDQRLRGYQGLAQRGRGGGRMRGGLAFSEDEMEVDSDD